MTKLSHRRSGITGIAMLAVFALVVGLMAGPAASSPGGGATVAAKGKKKKCKKPKKKKSSASTAGKGKKKGKCKKKKKKPTPVALQRAELRWNTLTDFDLWVFDAQGNRGRAAANGIPASEFSPNDTQGFVPETFTDKVFEPQRREFVYGVCFEDGGSNPTTFTLTYIDGKGISRTVSDTIGSDGGYRWYPETAPEPAPFCKAP